MKKTILLLAASTLIFGVVLTSCYTSAEKVENAQNNVNEANQDLNEANQEYLVDIENYRKESAAKIEANNKAIAEFNTRIANKKLAAKADYQKEIADLEKPNSDMKLKMENYKADGKDNWEGFKTEFGRDMDKLGQAFKDFANKNDK